MKRPELYFLEKVFTNILSIFATLRWGPWSSSSFRFILFVFFFSYRWLGRSKTHAPMSETFSYQPPTAVHKPCQKKRNATSSFCSFFFPGPPAPLSPNIAHYAVFQFFLQGLYQTLERESLPYWLQRLSYILFVNCFAYMPEFFFVLLDLQTFFQGVWTKTWNVSFCYQVWNYKLQIIPWSRGNLE